MAIPGCNTEHGYSCQKEGRGGGKERHTIFRWISRLIILPRLRKRARPSDPNRITPRGWCMIVPTKKLNVHLINRVCSSDCVRGRARRRKWKGRLDRIVLYGANPRPIAPFDFSPKFSVPRDNQHSAVPRWRSRSFDHTFCKSLKPFSTFESRWEECVTAFFWSSHCKGNVYNNLCDWVFPENRKRYLWYIILWISFIIKTL